MNPDEKIIQFLKALEDSLSSNSFVKISLGNYKGKEDNLKNIYIKKILIKSEEKLSFTYRYKTRDIVKNYSISESNSILQKLLTEGFYVATLFTTEYDVQYENFYDKKFTIRKIPATIKELPSIEHDRNKNRQITASSEKNYLFELGITDKSGNVLKNSQDKFKQINHYIENLSALLKEFSSDKALKVVDMGSGKGYLTFALYDYLKNILKIDASVTGVEIRPELVALCNRIAKDSGFEKLNFAEGSINDFKDKDIDVLIALHACDTATDDAIYKGILANAELIVAAPCCHKQIRKQIEKNKKQNELDFLIKHGIFLERQAEMVTDGMRSLIMEYFGYKTKVFEFIADAHTHKNVLIVGSKVKQSKDKKIFEKLIEIKAYFGIEYHHLERLLDL